MFLEVLLSSFTLQLASMIGHNVNASLAVTLVFHFSTIQFCRICTSNTVTCNDRDHKTLGFSLTYLCIPLCFPLGLPGTAHKR